MGSLTEDFIAIDTNVFVHLLNPDKNTKYHINTLLLHLINAKNEIKLLVDDKDEIKKEYCQYVEVRIDKLDEGDERIILTEWMNRTSEEVEVNSEDGLMTKIRRIIGNPKSRDKFFVYVAFKRGRILITNDRHDIIDEKTLGDGKRRRKLLGIPKKDGLKKGADILTSLEAHDKIAASS